MRHHYAATLCAGAESRGQIAHEMEPRQRNAAGKPGRNRHHLKEHQEYQ
jgi:hypothetical protein